MGTHKGKGLKFWGHTKERDYNFGDTQRKTEGEGLQFWGHTKEDERLNEIFNEDTQ